MPTRILALRHGETTWNAARRWQGQADTDLSDVGRRQALIAAEQLVRTPLVVQRGERQSEAEAASTAGAGSSLAATGARTSFDGIWASPLRRAAETAAIIAAVVGIGPVLVDDRLAETDVGPWEGLTFDEIEEGWPGQVGAGLRPEGAEDLDEVAARAAAAFVDIAATVDGGEVLVVTHAGLLRTVRRALGGEFGDRFPNLGGMWLIVDGERIVLGESVDLVVPDQPVPDSL